VGLADSCHLKLHLFLCSGLVVLCWTVASWSALLVCGRKQSGPSTIIW
jgi:hypothetical protein